MRRLFAIFLAFVIFAGTAIPVNTAQASQPDWETAMNRALDWIHTTAAPNYYAGAEWAILALARSGRVSADDLWIGAWLASLEDIQLRRKTDYQRVTIALTSLGFDASDFKGRDFTEPYRIFVPNAQRHAMNRAINTDIYALIALDTKPYDGEREQFIQSLLDSQRANGTWGLLPSLPASALDLDVTAMAVQALAPYYHSNPAVAAAVDTALRWLRRQAFPNPEGTAQMITALTALGPAFADEAKHYINWLLRWFDPASGRFRRPATTSPVNFMATEQAAYALVSYWRLINGLTSLYDMSDVFFDGREFDGREEDSHDEEI